MIWKSCISKRIEQLQTGKGEESRVKLPKKRFSTEAVEAIV